MDSNQLSEDAQKRLTEHRDKQQDPVVNQIIEHLDAELKNPSLDSSKKHSDEPTIKPIDPKGSSENSSSSGYPFSQSQLSDAVFFGLGVFIFLIGLGFSQFEPYQNKAHRSGVLLGSLLILIPVVLFLFVPGAQVPAMGIAIVGLSAMLTIAMAPQLINLIFKTLKICSPDERKSKPVTFAIGLALGFLSTIGLFLGTTAVLSIGIPVLLGMGTATLISLLVQSAVSTFLILVNSISHTTIASLLLMGLGLTVIGASNVMKIFRTPLQKKTKDSIDNLATIDMLIDSLSQELKSESSHNKLAKPSLRARIEQSRAHLKNVATESPSAATSKQIIMFSEEKNPAEKNAPSSASILFSHSPQNGTTLSNDISTKKPDTPPK